VVEVSLEEVHNAVFQLGAQKASGPDGLNGIFYQHHWDIISNGVFEEVRGFFHSGILEPALNRTHMALIPKTPHPK